MVKKRKPTEAEEQKLKDAGLRTPPFARCVEDASRAELPENAGRHAAPDPVDETRETMEYLRDLRGAAGTPRRAC